MRIIQTVYNGYYFRSRLEAKWAVFFDAAGIQYNYEPEGYIMDNGATYLPDFYLPENDVYVEIKGKPLSDEEWNKIDSFAREKYDMPITGTRFRLLRDIPLKPPILCYMYVGPTEIANAFPGMDKPIYGCLVPGFWIPAKRIETIDDALLKARMARFEHGEKPRVANRWR